MKNTLQHFNGKKIVLVALLICATVSLPFAFSPTTVLAQTAPTCSNGSPGLARTDPAAADYFSNAPSSAQYVCASAVAGGTGELNFTYYDTSGQQIQGAVATQDATGLTVCNGTNTANPNCQKKTTVTDCSAFLTFMASPFTCMFRSLVSNTAASLIWIARWVLIFSGALFNWLVQNTIVSFGSVYTSLVQTAVQNAWAAFRDIANILIIGIFAFIAISIILGLKTFGQKKLIANVLIVAVLINFSLLFAKIIIDASNFTATQIYAAASLGTVNSIGGSTTGNVAVTTSNVTGANAGIAGQFIYLMGVQSFGDTKTALDNIAQAQDNGWVALFHGIFVFLILVGAAIVLFYGSFLLVSRVILIIFLMVTASVAFASYLVPKWQTSHYGWDTWWNSLIKSAVFAPILMFFLWMTLTVAYAIHAGPGGGSFGDMMANPTKLSNTNEFVSYAIILGLLFISFKLSNIFAGKIAGFNFASMAAALPLSLGSRFIAAPLLRQTAGRAAGALKDRFNGSAQAATSEAARREEQAKHFGVNTTAGRIAMAEAERQKKKAATRAGLAGILGGAVDKKFNFMDTAAAKQAMKVAGVSGFAAGASKGEKGFAGQIKAAAEAAEKKTPAISDKQKDDIRKEAVDNARDTRRREREQKQTAKENAEQLKSAIGQVVEQQKRGLEQQQSTAQQTLEQQKQIQRENEADHQRTLETIRNDAGKDTATKTMEIELQKARRESQLRGEAENIVRAQSRVKEIQDKIDIAHKTKRFDDGTEVLKPLEDAAKDLEKATSALEEHDSKNSDEIKKLADKTYGEKLGNLENARSDVAAELGRREFYPPRRYVDGDKVAKETRGKIKSSKEKSSVLKLIEEQIKKDNGGAAPAGGGAGGGH